MAEVWQTIEQAAVTLGLSVRTVNRHITGGKLQSRLFEGRREVLVSFAEPIGTRERIPRQTPSATAAPTSATVTASAPEPVNFTMGSEAASVSAGHSAPPNQPYDSVRRAMAADYATEKPLDMQTMLTLADSVDDKASLAVAAYQTLAHSAEVQVQSLRRVALGAWASVGLLAAGAIVAVGWGTYRLTWAEGAAAALRTQVDEQKDKIQTLEVEGDLRQKNLEQARLEAAKLQMELERLPSADVVADLARFALQHVREAPTEATTRPTSNSPTSDKQASGKPAPDKTASEKLAPDKPAVAEAVPATAPATQPATQPGAMAGGAPLPPPIRAPLTQPASMPATTGQRPTYITNSREPFDSR